MKNKIVVITGFAVGVTAFLAGTALSGEGEKDKQAKMPEPPPPPAELKALNAFVGQWRGTYEHLPAMFGEAATGIFSVICWNGSRVHAGRFMTCPLLKGLLTWWLTGRFCTCCPIRSDR